MSTLLTKPKSCPVLEQAEDRTPTNPVLRPYYDLLLTKGVDANWLQDWIAHAEPKYWEDAVLRVLAAFQHYQQTGERRTMDGTWSDNELSLFEQLQYPRR